jgi:hypothetical protein
MQYQYSSTSTSAGAHEGFPTYVFSFRTQKIILEGCFFEQSSSPEGDDAAEAPQKQKTDEIHGTCTEAFISNPAKCNRLLRIAELHLY